MVLGVGVTNFQNIHVATFLVFCACMYFSNYRTLHFTFLRLNHYFSIPEYNTVIGEVMDSGTAHAMKDIDGEMQWIMFLVLIFNSDEDGFLLHK